MGAIEKNSKPVVLHLTSGLGLGGIEYILLDDVRGSPNTTHVAYLKEDSDQLIPYFKEAGSTPLLVRGRNILHKAGHVVRVVSDKNVDIVHTHSGRARVIASVSRYCGLGVPLVHTEHGSWSMYSITRATIDAILLRTQYDRVMAVSEAVAASVRSPLFGVPALEKPIVIRGGVDLQASSCLDARSAREALGLDERFTFGTVGNLRPEKNQALLVEAIGAMERRGVSSDEIQVVIIGEGPEREALRERIHRLGLSDSAHMVGSIPNARRYMKAFDVYCLPSTTEGLPVSMLEAANAGLPIVATAVGGIEEFVKDGVTGLLVGPEDRDRMAESLMRLLRSEELRKSLGEAAAAVVEEYSHAENVSLKYDVYRELIDSGGISGE